ncbi:MAG: thiamine-phosphate kinase [Cyanobacteriota bacterium]
MKEYEIIKKIKAIVDNDLNLIGDDTAIIKESGLVLTCDTLVQGTHFKLETTSAFDLGHKAAAVNLSDIAASAGYCKYLLVSLAIPDTITESFIIDFYKGMKKLCDKFNTFIIGGDLTRSNQLVITVTAIGKTDKVSGRSYAGHNQVLLTTGSYGSSYIGLQILENKLDINKNKFNNEYKSVINSHLKPWPRLDESQFFIHNTNYNKYCMMDTSDGLADALYQISQKSQVRLEINVNDIPVNSFVKDICFASSLNYLDIALYGGEDFELLITCDKKDVDKLINCSSFKFSIIGKIFKENPGVSLINNGEIIELSEDLLDRKISFKHF